jgi:hypothetical protein
MGRIGQPLFAALALAWVAFVAAAGGCSGSQASGFGDTSSSGGGADSSVSGDDSSGGFSVTDSGFGSFGGGSGGSPPSCANGMTGWKCSVDTSCSSSSPTTLKGKVFDPAGANPLYDVVVFIPNVVASLPPVVPGTHTCNTCDVSIGDYVVATQTDATGSFTLKGVPTGKGVPVTVQIGKWRRTTTVDITSSCSTTTVSNGTLRLPKNHKEGDMPQMAVLTGGCDDLGCFMTNIGIDPAEFSAPNAGGRLDVYSGVLGASLSSGTAGACGGAGCPLWASKHSFEYYDIVMLSCECGEQTNTNESTAAYTNLHDWLNEGGKVFASHYHYTWFQNSPDPAWKAVATWLGGSIALGSGTYDLNTTFPKGMVFGAWLNNVGALAGNASPPTINLSFVASSASTVNTKTATQWIYDPATSPNDSKYLSFETPIGGAPAADSGPEGPPQYCGKAVFTDLHTGGSLFSTVTSIPSGCTKAALSPQQKALEFLFFDLSACVTSDTIVPPLPPPPPQ